MNKEQKITIIKLLLEKGKTQAQIVRETGIPQQTVSRLTQEINNGGNNEKKIRSKLPQKYIDRMYKMASNKAISEMSGGKIANKINKSLKRDNIKNKKGQIKSISVSQVNRILKRKFKRIYKKKKSLYINQGK